MGTLAPTFDEWVEYCFTQGYSDFHASPKSPDCEAVQSRVARFVDLPPEVLAGFVIKLFRAPAFIADLYADDQIGNATWFLFGSGSGYFYDLRSRAVPRDVQVECFSSVARVYTDLFDRVCCKHGSDPEGEFLDSLEVDKAVYMIWDMGGMESAIMDSKANPYLVEPGLHVLDTVLTRCRTSSCQASALHGLGHLHAYHGPRTDQIIDAFLARGSGASWVRDYAQAARTGCIQ